MSYLNTGDLEFPKEKFSTLLAIAEDLGFKDDIYDDGYISFEDTPRDIENDLRKLVVEAYKAGIPVKGKIHWYDSSSGCDGFYCVENGKLDCIDPAHNDIREASTEDLIAELKRRGEYKLEVPTPAGIIKAEPCADPNHPGIFLALTPKGFDIEIDLSLAEAEEKSENVSIFTWGNPSSEDWSRKDVIRRADVVSALKDI